MKRKEKQIKFLYISVVVFRCYAIWILAIRCSLGRLLVCVVGKSYSSMKVHSTYSTAPAEESKSDIPKNETEPDIIYSDDISMNTRNPGHWEFANGPGDWVSIQGRVIPNTQKMVLNAALINTQHYKVRIKGKVEQFREWSSALPYTSV